MNIYHILCYRILEYFEAKKRQLHEPSCTLNGEISMPGIGL